MAVMKSQSLFVWPVESMAVSVAAVSKYINKKYIKVFEK